MILCGIAISFFIPGQVIGKSNIENPHIEKKGRLTIFNFDIKLTNKAKPMPVRVVVSRETKFRASFGIASNFPHIETAQLRAGEISWSRENEPAGKAHVADSSVGVFLAFDGDLGYIQSRLHSHRVYRKYLDEFEIDYVFSNDSVSRNELVKFIHTIDKEVFDMLKNNGAFYK